MALRTINTADADLTRVQENVAVEFNRIERLIPGARTSATRVTADYTVQATDSLVLCGPQMPVPLNITLPFASVSKGQTFTVKNISAASTVNVRGAFVNGARELIDGAMPYVLPIGGVAACYSDGTSWWVV